MWIRSILAVVSGPVVFGLLCVPVNFLIVKLFPSYFDKNWMTRHTGFLVLLVSLTVVFAGASGLVGSLIAREKILYHAMAMGIVQLAIGIAVQSRYWNTLPLWYHLSFFVLLIVGIGLGAWLGGMLIR